MVMFCREGSPKTTKRCRFISSVLKDPFSKCRTCHRRRLSYSSSEEDETPISDFEDMQEMIVSVIRSRALEARVRRRGSMTHTYSVFHPTSGELFLGSATRQCEEIKEEEEKEDFASVQSNLSPRSFASVDDTETFYSMKTKFSCCSSSKDPKFAEKNCWTSEVLDSTELRRRAIIQEICHCKGWPFGLCRKALLLPPLPKSPSESWSWCKGSPIVKTP